ncbi:hypothetical protein Ddc_18316 [Ditylenchus destructor]|nr:hypothetical protein Ddc_18316 [Ditylenchus destructor]
MVPSAPVRESISAAWRNGGFVSANSRPSVARTVALSVPTRGLRSLERWLYQCQLAAFGRSIVVFQKMPKKPFFGQNLKISAGAQKTDFTFVYQLFETYKMRYHTSLYRWY